MFIVHLNRMTFRLEQISEIILEKFAFFDGELRCLRHEKFELDIVLKNAEFR